MHAGTHIAYMCTHAHMHIYAPLLGTKYQAGGLTSRSFLLERLLESCRPATHVTYEDTQGSPGREETRLQLLSRGKALGGDLNSVAKSQSSEHKTKTIPLQNVSFRLCLRMGCAIFFWVLPLAGNTHFRRRWLYQNSCFVKGAGRILTPGFYIGWIPFHPTSSLGLANVDLNCPGERCHRPCLAVFMCIA